MSKREIIVENADGAKVFRKALDGLGKKLRGKIVRQALRKGAKVFAAEVKAHTPVESGKMKASVKVRGGKRKKDVISILVDISGGHPDAVPQFIEFGRKGVEAQPFIRPAFHKKKAEVSALLVDQVKAGIESAGK